MYKNIKSVIDIFGKVLVTRTIIFEFIATFLKAVFMKILSSVNFSMFTQYVSNFSLRLKNYKVENMTFLKLMKFLISILLDVVMGNFRIIFTTQKKL